MTDLTPAQALRKAAERIREVAHLATSGPWLNLDRGDRIIRDQGEDHDGSPDYVVDEPLEANRDNGEHIALWHPGVAVLVANILTIAAESAEAMEWQNSREGDARTRILPSDFDVVALDLARRIIAGGES